MRTHLLAVTSAFKQMSEMPVSLEQVDRYFVDVAHYSPKPGARRWRTHLSEDQISRFPSTCREQFFRLHDGAGTQTQTSLWNAYNAVIEWVDHEGSTLQGWNRLDELWLSGIKDSALYVALKRIGHIGKDSRSGRGSR
ncbi:DUF932 domain-containing protein [Acidicapsa dinghuensis]